ncbi:nitrate- and nitrite sensing domain-containing protein [Nocardia sp. 2]|uniref:histidine kinase n=1 Tax=Nocardia acididurans TaxID=2802282 RepID=A0ABS1MD83_9NOCA|nr:nitrate- and nitrite sensing domain-containing protein [Nocardia acididurans]MBL1078521.1 nitrate- and nitrite sensing domain-containing protein [Nocardia acididurans]
MFESLRRPTGGTRTLRGKTYSRLGVRARLLAIVLVSSITLLVIGVGAAGYLVRTGQEAADWAELAARTTEPGREMVEAYQDERLASLRYLAGEPATAVDLAGTRARTDAAAAAARTLLEANAAGLTSNNAEQMMSYGELYEKFPLFRSGIDARQIPVEQVFALYGGIIGTGPAATMYSAGVAPDAAIGAQLTYSVPAMRAAEGLSLTIALGSFALATGGPDARTLVEIGRAIGDYRGEVAFAMTLLQGERLTALQTLTASRDWQTLTSAEEALVRGETVLPVTVAEWRDAGVRTRDTLMRVWQQQTNAAHAIARERGSDTALGSLYGGAAVLAIAVLAFLIALVLANRFVARTRLLHRHTLELADNRLPELMRRLRAGEPVDPAEEVAGPAFGRDEIGHVAAAFDRAHLAAVSAAVAESKTRAGVNAVFLNIAHRSQVVVHRQLALLDEAERGEENPHQLDLLFQLDHLATRARRNAENLIILGGEQPGRRWRKPVPLVDLVRGAVAESLDYSRIRTGRLPEVSIEGKAVADLIHAMAELMDNATAFSPPNSVVEVFGAAVGRGVAVEIEDQGLGMSAEEIAERNEMLSHPPDFSVAALTADIRLGLFVVAKLAARHGISVRLTESVYGGIRAVMIIPSALVAEPEADHPDRDAELRREPALLRRESLRGRLAAQRDNPIAAPQVPLALGSTAAAAASDPTGPQPISPDPEPVPETWHRTAAALRAPFPPPAGGDRALPPPGERPALPRRSRNSAVVQPIPEIEPEPSAKQRSAAQARDRVSAVVYGSRRGRHRPS